MAETCCVDGCVPTKEDVTYFKFPNSKTLRRKWLAAIRGSVKVTLDTAVCSQHFLAEQYELVRGRRRLKAKVVPSVFTTRTISNPKSPQSPQKTALSDSEDSIPLGRVKSVTTDNTDTEPSRPSPDHRLEDAENSVENGVKEDEIVKRKPPENISATDSESNKDIEDIITHYQIKQIRPLHKPTDTNTDTDTQTNTDTNTHIRVADISIEIEVPAVPCPAPGDIANGAIGDNGTTDNIIDVDDEAEPVFIEVAVGKEGEEEEATNQDCMMLLESVQCEVDPTCLMFPPEDPDPDPGNDSDVIDLGEKKADPVSLLTSSDEDEVIIEEPKYEMIEVSDETDEDDLPLVKLVDRPKTKTNKPSYKELTKTSNTDTFTKMLFGRLYEYYCLECQYCSTSYAEYRRHVQEHSTIVQVCDVCGFTTASKHQFTLHKRKHLEDKRFKCHLCKYKARHNISLILHLKTHDVEVVSGLGKFKCEKCKFETRSKKVLLHHVRTCSGEVKRFGCNRCPYQTDRSSDLKRHNAWKHPPKQAADDDEYVPPRRVYQHVGRGRNSQK